MGSEERKKEKSLEMRVAELEDKLAQVSITEEEMKTYQKVAAALGPGAAQPGMAAAPTAVTAAPPVAVCHRHWYHNWYHQHYHNWYWQHQPCYECGPGGPGGPGPGTFGGLGR